MRTCNLLLTILANFFFPSSNLLIVLVHPPHDFFPLLIPRCHLLLHKLFSVHTLSQVLGHVFLSHHLTPTMFIVHVMISVDFVYLHTHDVLDSDLSHATGRFAVDIYADSGGRHRRASCCKLDGWGE